MRDLWTPERENKFAKLWNQGAPMRRISQECQVPDGLVRRAASHLRKRGVQLVQRKKSRPGGVAKLAHKILTETAWGPMQAERTRESKLAPVILYNGQGVRVGVMDPYTRVREMSA